jgi:cysteine synthase A
LSNIRAAAPAFHSLVCAVKRHPLYIVTSDAFAEEKLDHMRLLGAKLEVIRSKSGGMTEALTREMIRVAGSIFSINALALL